MKPAFSSPRQAVAFAVLLLTLLVLPAVLAKTRCIDKRDFYPAVNVKYGPFTWVHEQTYCRTGDVDLAIMGSSRIWNAMNTPYIQKKFTESLGHESQVMSMCWPWPGFDAVYIMARNLMDRRHVRMLVVYAEDHPEGMPHRHAHRWFSLGDDGDVLAGLPATSQAQLYGDAILGLPRQLISLVRANRIDPPDRCRPNFWNFYYRAPNLAENLGALRARLGSDVSPRFVPVEPHGSATPADVLIYSPETRASFKFTGPRQPAYGMHFMRKLAQLCRERGTRLVFVHPPAYSERAETTVNEFDVWPEVLGAPADIVGIPPAKLFAGISPADVKELYFEDHHFNVNGQDLFTTLITPTLLKLYDVSIKTH